MGRNARYACGEALHRDLIRVIKQHFHRSDFGVRELATYLNAEQSSLRRWCNKLLNTAPSKLIQKQRVEHAKGLLLVGKRPSDVAHAVGFSEHKSFSTAFKEATGVTPRDYLKRMTDAD